MTLRQRIEEGAVVAAPGVYDGFSALVARELAPPAVYLSGYLVAASRHGLPDAGLIGLAEMLDAIRLVRRVCPLPLIADADTGYGGLLNVQHTVREYERAGVAAIQLEDQEMPKKCGHTRGKRVVPATEMAAKVSVAAEARTSDDLLIIARTDALATHGLDEALERIARYAEAGADVVFVDALTSPEELAAVGAAGGAPKMVNVTPPTPEFVTPPASLDELGTLGFSIAIYPGMLAWPALGAYEHALRGFAADGRQVIPAPSASFDVHELVGFEAVWEDERRWQERFGVLDGEGVPA